MTKDEALKLALEALTNAYWPTESDLMPAHNIKECAEAIIAIKEALANEALEKMAENARELGLDYEPAQEPVAWEQFYPEIGKPKLAYLPPTESPDNACYTPPQRTWVGLTDEELQPIADEYRILFGSWVTDFARAIEAKLRSKNESKN